MEEDSSRQSKSVHEVKKKGCPVCKKVFRSNNLAAHLKTHLVEGERVKFKCPVDQCTKEYLGRSDLHRHVTQIHSGSGKKYDCSLCDASFTSKLGRDYHIVAAHTGEKAFQCKECPAKFVCASSLRSHQLVHIEGTSTKCKICPKSFAQTGNLRRHFKNIHSQRRRNFECSICQSTFFRKRHLDQHSRTHNVEVGKYPCYFCSKSFLRKEEQEIHLRIHTREKPFPCSDPSCKYSTSTAAYLKRHKKCHNPPNSEEIWTCYFCSHLYSTLSLLLIHLRNHTLESPFTCALCQKSFNSNAILHGHIFTHTKEKPFKCPHCQKCFSFNGSLKRHITGRHPSSGETILL